MKKRGRLWNFKQWTPFRGVDEAWDALEQMHVEGKTTDKCCGALGTGRGCCFPVQITAMVII